MARNRHLELVLPGRSPEGLARELGPAVQTIRNWLKQGDLDQLHNLPSILRWVGRMASRDREFFSHNHRGVNVTGSTPLPADNPLVAVQVQGE